ncbi:MAG: mRNA splicing protein [Alectoria fallacina]|uniref:Pre-mRNA-splicing factor SLU7 n=1 Tax=Alectoria fallacina TaxID=1903189 RepID=A0A8H3J8S7_9LECA|nr:MAG: mRNA splicing protein [Alectoria fallacina]
MSRKPAEPAKKEQNEYIPSFISKKPFYLESADSENDYLEHQRLQTSTPDQSKWYDRGKRLGPAATKFRKGACENCGALTHKTKDCLSRPRAKGARWTGKDIQADEVVQDVQLGWDAKRDRWNGYDAEQYRDVTEEWEELENLKKRLKGREAEANGQKLLTDDGEQRPEGEEEEAKYAEESDMGRQQSTATRNLRIREDTAKYLLNLDLDSAKYDPKTRSMVDMGAQADQAAALVAEDNFMRASGDAAEFERAQKYAWESQERGDKNKTHLQANPTSGEYFRRKEKEETDTKREAQQKLLLERYGGEQHLHPSQSRDMAVVENERYVEYDETGAIKGARKAEAKSKYPEHVFINNHTSVWGSWWSNFQWGYACCHSKIKNSYCTGEEGKLAFEETNAIRTGGELNDVPSLKATELAQNDGIQTEEKEELVENKKVDGKSEAVAKKRTLTDMKSGVSEEELEAYKRSRAMTDDPMAKLLGTDELLL